MAETSERPKWTERESARNEVGMWRRAGHVRENGKGHGGSQWTVTPQGEVTRGASAIDSTAIVDPMPGRQGRITQQESDEQEGKGQGNDRGV